MKIYKLIDSLLSYGLNNKLINEYDYYYSLNALLSALNLQDYNKSETELISNLDDILDGMIEYAISNNIIENSQESKDLFDSKIMGLLTPKPSEIISTFNNYYSKDYKLATDYFYKLSKEVNYIRTSRIKKDICFDYLSEYGLINISINMSKPEKDPNDIKKLLTQKKVGYPKCMLCEENVNYEGRIGFPARQNLRYIPIILNNEKFNIQYSPYSYYNEHLICFHSEHFNMKIDKNTFAELLDFVDMFPHYFIGSNADLPIVGGSILNHHHYQGGRHILPMENAKEILLKKVNDISIYKLHWPLSVIRLKGKNKTDIINLANEVLQNWKNYNNDKLFIINKDDNGNHNTITPISRYKNGLYELDLVLRNNITSEERPLGIFHPQEKYFHIKKENIGLIEVMGLAILPSRLKNEMNIVKKYLMNEKLSDKENGILYPHLNWADNIKESYSINTDNVNDIINNEIGKVFVNVLKDCGVFKENNQKEFDEFIFMIKGD